MRRIDKEYDDYPPKDSFTDQVIPMFVYVVVLGIAAVFIGIGILLGRIPDLAYKNCTEEVQAIVTDNVKKDDTYSPEFTFEYNGKKYTVVSNASTNPPMFSEGEEVNILIDPENPERIHPPMDKIFSFLKLIFCAVGIIHFIIAAVLFIYSVIRTSEKGSEYT